MSREFLEQGQAGRTVGDAVLRNENELPAGRLLKMTAAGVTVLRLWAGCRGLEASPCAPLQGPSPHPLGAVCSLCKVGGRETTSLIPPCSY